MQRCMACLVCCWHLLFALLLGIRVVACSVALCVYYARHVCKDTCIHALKGASLHTVLAVARHRALRHPICSCAYIPAMHTHTHAPRASTPLDIACTAAAWQVFACHAWHGFADMKHVCSNLCLLDLRHACAMYMYMPVVMQHR